MTAAAADLAPSGPGMATTRVGHEPDVGPRRDTWTLKTALRPDYYEYFPRFSPQELKSRLVRLPFHRATLLTEWNIREARKISTTAQLQFDRELLLSYQKQRQHLLEVLTAVGVSQSVTMAMSRVDRHNYVPYTYRALAYLNAHIPIAPGTCLSPPGTVALMLDRLNIKPGSIVLEFGAGSGYHLACAAELTGRGGRTIGADLLPLNTVNVNKSPHQRITADLLYPPIRLESVDFLYTTCLVSQRADKLRSVMTPAGTLQIVEPLRATEYNTEPRDSWLRLSFSSYDEYLKALPQQYACIREYARVDGKFALIGSLYDVSFVHARSASATPPPLRVPYFG